MSSSTRIINFIRGQPPPRQLVRAATILQESAASAFARSGCCDGSIEDAEAGAWTLLGYSAHLRPDRNASFVSALSKFLSSFPECKSPPPESLYPVPGASYALDLLCRVARPNRIFPESDATQDPADALAAPGRHIVYVESPTYFLAKRVFDDHERLRVVPVPIDEHGLRVDLLEASLEALPDAEKNAVCMVYTVPVHHNPSGATLSDARRAHLVSLSKKHRFAIVADEVYQTLTFSSAREELPGPLASYDYGPDYNVFSLGSFSKISSPGLRLGWIQAHPSLLGRCGLCRGEGESGAVPGYQRSGGSLTGFSEAMVQRAIEGGALRLHVEAVRRELEQGALRLVLALREGAAVEGLPEDTFHFSEPRGGYFLWLAVRLRPEISAGDVRNGAPAEEDGARFVEKLRKEGVLVLLGSVCNACEAGSRLEIAEAVKTGVWRVRLCFAYLSQAELRRGGLEIARVVREMRLDAAQG
jgi:2-aminoadipate transaminase